MRLASALVRWSLAFYLSPLILFVLALGLIGLLATKFLRSSVPVGTPEACACGYCHRLRDPAAVPLGGDLSGPHRPIPVAS